MPIRIQSAIYNNLPGNSPALTKFQSERWTVSGLLDYTVGLAIATAWSYRLVVSASASALGGGVSAGGVNTLRASFALVSTTGNVNQLQIVTDEAVTATAYMKALQLEQQLSPTMYLYRVDLSKVQ